VSEEPLHLLSGAYALNALALEEREAFEDHLSTCDSCRAEVAGLTTTAARLAEPIAVAPPARLKADLLPRLDEVRQLPPRTPPLEELPISRERRRMRVLLAAAAGIVLAAGAATTWTMVRYHDVAQRERAITRVLAAPDARAVPSTTPSWRGIARVIVSRQRGEGVLVAGAELAAPPAGKTYELWYISATGARPAGTFAPHARGLTRVITGAVGDATLVAVTIEPTGGRDKPSGSPVATFPLPAA